MIRLAEKKDYLQLASIKWEHCQEDDEVYGENNLKGVDKNSFVNEFVRFLETDKSYHIFVYEKNKEIASAMFVNVIPKVPKPNGKTKSIAYLTNVHTLKKYRNNGIGTELLQYVINYCKEQRCELIMVYPSDNSVEWYKRNGFSSESEAYECNLQA